LHAIESGVGRGALVFLNQLHDFQPGHFLRAGEVAKQTDKNGRHNE
jgi:hypothetical protein